MLLKLFVCIFHRIRVFLYLSFQLSWRRTLRIMDFGSALAQVRDLFRVQLLLTPAQERAACLMVFDKIRASIETMILLRFCLGIGLHRKQSLGLTHTGRLQSRLKHGQLQPL